jgi:hypothetical protein
MNDASGVSLGANRFGIETPPRRQRQMSRQSRRQARAMGSIYQRNDGLTSDAYPIHQSLRSHFASAESKLANAIGDRHLTHSQVSDIGTRCRHSRRSSRGRNRRTANALTRLALTSPVPRERSRTKWRVRADSDSLAIGYAESRCSVMDAPRPPGRRCSRNCLRERSCVRGLASLRATVLRPEARRRARHRAARPSSS